MEVRGLDISYSQRLGIGLLLGGDIKKLCCDKSLFSSECQNNATSPSRRGLNHRILLNNLSLFQKAAMAIMYYVIFVPIFIIYGAVVLGWIFKRTKRPPLTEIDEKQMEEEKPKEE